MSRFYRKNNDESTKNLFEKKLIYDLKLMRSNTSTALVDFTFAEKALYGRVNRLYLPIVVADTTIPLKNIKSAANPNGLKAMNFVSDAFDALSKNFQKKAMLNEISNSEEFLTHLKAYKGYVSHTKAYSDHINSYVSAFKKIVKKKNIKFADFEHFVARVFPSIIEATKKQPFTLPAFVKSRLCPIFCSGLAIKVSELKPSDDTVKIKKFVENKNWNFYVNACESYGFTIDKNNPDVLVADIASAEMLKYAEPYGIRTTDSVLSAGYLPAHDDYLEKFKAILFRMYMDLKVKRYHSETKITPDRTKQVIVRPIDYTYEEFTRIYNDAYFLKLYCKIRFAEEESHFTEQEMLSLIDNTIELSYSGLNRALHSFEIIVNKTFDYRGSLSYHKERVKILEK
ncbi:MAG: hypothetical protein CMF52_03250 [Legionellales bacterium]|nr:hypothetical protein [Legionellales bacterium]|tara:strand:- start:48 stop:1241 length:1194 start_codon:yes stop_codon:yes gene_type:complete